MNEPLSNSDIRRIKNCEYYLQTKQIMLNHEAYKGFEVGEVFFIKRKDRDGKEQYVTAHYGSDIRVQLMVFHKDEEGFIFAKRIISNGKLGKEVTCITTSYNCNDYILEPDPEYVNSLILGEEGYDPLKTSKQLTSNKNKARRKNKKFEVKFEDAKDAYDYVKKLRPGHKLYDASTNYGSNIIEWVVGKMEVRAPDMNKSNYSYGSCAEYAHVKNNLPMVVIAHLKAVGGSPLPGRQWANKEDKLDFRDMMKNSWRVFYSTKPFTVDDV